MRTKIECNSEIIEDNKTTQMLYRFKLSKVESDIFIDIDKQRITSDDIAEKVARKLYDDDIAIYESFYTLYLNNKNQVIGYTKISQGGFNSTTVEPLLIIKPAIDSLSKKVILVHNHPSGELVASKKDIEMTEKIIKMLSLFDIEVLDHLILSENGYLSIRGTNLVKFEL